MKFYFNTVCTVKLNYINIQINIWRFLLLSTYTNFHLLFTYDQIEIQSFKNKTCCF